MMEKLIKIQLGLGVVTLAAVAWVGVRVKQLEGKAGGGDATFDTSAPTGGSPGSIRSPSFGGPSAGSSAGSPSSSMGGGAPPSQSPPPSAASGQDNIQRLRKALDFVGAGADQKARIEGFWSLAESAETAGRRKAGAESRPWTDDDWKKIVEEFEQKAFAILTDAQKAKMKEFKPPQ